MRVATLIETMYQDILLDTGFYPSLVRMHPDTFQRMKTECFVKAIPAVRVSGAKIEDVVFTAITTQCGTLQIVEDDTIPVDTVKLE